MSTLAPPATLDRIRRHLVALKMPTAIERLDSLIQRFEQGQVNPYELIEQLFAEERHVRENRRLKMALLTARLTTLKTLESFDFSFQPSIDRNRILSLAQLQFVERCEVVHFLGPPGTGKSHLALALGVEAVKAGKSVYFTTLGELVSALSKAEREGQLRERLRFYARNALLIVDEIGYLPLQSGGANLFFQLINARYERGALILTSNRGFGEWAEIFGDPVVASALLDRLLHHAVVIAIEGNSYRLREHAELVPEPLRTAALRLPQPQPVPEAKKRRGRPSKSVSAARSAPSARS
jgi:DNA replication protein DnaC